MPQTQQPGIQRGPYRVHRLRLVGKAEPEALAKDVNGIGEALDRISGRLDETEDRLSARINEMLLSGLLSQRPEPGVADRFYFATDGPALYYDNGTEWILVSGSAAETQSAVLLDGATTTTFTVSQADANYAPAFSTTWWTMTKITAKSASSLTVEYSNPASAGDVVTLVIS